MSLGQELSQLQDSLAKKWNDGGDHGPGAVYDEHVAKMDRLTLERLVMANLHRRSVELKNA